MVLGVCAEGVAGREESVGSKKRSAWQKQKAEFAASLGGMDDLFASENARSQRHDEEREAAIARLGDNAVITRFKGLGEINQEEFADFIGEGMRLDQVRIHPGDPVDKLLEFYMGKNTPDRQNFIIDNLREDV